MEVRLTPDQEAALMAHGLSPQVEIELDDIWYYIARESGSTEVADRLIDSLTDRFFLLANHPYLGRAAAMTICSRVFAAFLWARCHHLSPRARGRAESSRGAWAAQY